MRGFRNISLLLLLFASLVSACGRAPAGRQYEFRGQILDVRAADRMVTIRHDDIKDFMPAMTMPFTVKDAKLLEGKARGDLVKGILLVTDMDAYVTRLDTVGHADVVATAAPPPPTSTQLLHPGAEVPNVRLVDSAGRPVEISSLRGSAVALTFIYTRCPLPTFCPLIDRKFGELAKKVRGNDRLRQTVQLLSISFDPEYDTPDVLAAHSKAVGADGTTWKFVTADRKTIDAFAARFGVVLMRDTPGSITHNLRTAIVDSQGRLVRIYSGSDWTVDEVVAGLAAAAGQ